MSEPTVREALEKVRDALYEHYNDYGICAIMDDLADMEAARDPAVKAIYEAARALVAYVQDDGEPWWGYVYDGMTLECAVCGASVPGTDETPDVETFAGMRHRSDCPAMQLDKAVREGER